MIGIINPTTGKFVKTAGNLTTYNAPKADKNTDGIMSSEQAEKLEKSYTTDDIASSKQIIDLLFKKGES